jgi:hypothetical protein
MILGFPKATQNPTLLLSFLGTHYTTSLQFFWFLKYFQQGIGKLVEQSQKNDPERH